MMTGTTLEPSGVILDGVPSTIMLCHDAATPKPAEILAGDSQQTIRHFSLDGLVPMLSVGS